MRTDGNVTEPYIEMAKFLEARSFNTREEITQHVEEWIKLHPTPSWSSHDSYFEYILTRISSHLHLDKRSQEYEKVLYIMLKSIEHKPIDPLLYHPGDSSVSKRFYKTLRDPFKTYPKGSPHWRSGNE